MPAKNNHAKHPNAKDWKPLEMIQELSDLNCMHGDPEHLCKIGRTKLWPVERRDWQLSMKVGAQEVQLKEYEVKLALRGIVAPISFHGTPNSGGSLKDRVSNLEQAVKRFMHAEKCVGIVEKVRKPKPKSASGPRRRNAFETFWVLLPLRILCHTVVSIFPFSVTPGHILR